MSAQRSALSSLDPAWAGARRFPGVTFSWRAPCLDCDLIQHARRQGVAPDSAARRVRIRPAGMRQPTIGIIIRLASDTISLRAVEGDLAVARTDMTKGVTF